jgi:hypothetical protein
VVRDGRREVVALSSTRGQFFWDSASPVALNFLQVTCCATGVTGFRVVLSRLRVRSPYSSCCPLRAM